MSYEDLPLNPTQRTLRKVVGQDGDTGVEAHAKLDRIKLDTNTTRTNTTNLPTVLGNTGDYLDGSVPADLALLNNLLEALGTDSASIIAILENGSFGNEAIQDAITAARAVLDTVNANLGDPATGDVATNLAAVKSETALIKTDTTDIINLIGTPATGAASSLGADNAEIISKIDQIQNNTRTTVALLSEMEVPAAGEDYFLIQLNNFDNTGNMEPLDAAPTVAVTTFTGTDRTGNLVDDVNAASATMIEDSDGRYHIRYKVAHDATVNEGLLFTFTLVESGVTRKIDRLSRIVEEVSSTFTVSDRNNLNAVIADTDELQSLQVPAIKTVVDDIQSTANDIDVITQAMDGKLDSIDSDLNIIQNKAGTAGYDRTTDSLEAISEKVDDLTSDVAGISAVSSVTQSFMAVKASGSISSGGIEMVELDAAAGVASPNCKIVTLKVIPRTTTCTDFTVEVFEKDTTDASFLFAKFTKARPDRGDLALRINQNYYNREATPASKIWVRITNEDDSGSTIFDVEVRADVIELL